MNDSAVAALACRPGPLNGVLVLELCGDEPAGTFGTQILGDLGATVIKIERIPEGEPPEFQATAVEAELAPLPEAIAYFWGMNRNKLSLALDVKSDAGRALLHSLVKMADVVYDNFRPEVMQRMGADAATLRALNPQLICASVTGFGRSGPLAGYPAYDATIQAMGGGMSITGASDPDSMPVRCGNPIGGLGGALYAVIGILAALARRRRTAGGAALDIALFDVQLAMNAYRVPPALGAGRRYTAEPHRGGHGALPYGPYRARCGRWFVLGITKQFWSKACAVLAQPQWEQDPRFRTEDERKANEPALNAAVSAVIATRDADDWQARFIEAGIPGATVRSISEAFEHPHVAPRHMLEGFDHPLGQHLKVAGDPIKLSRHAHAAFAGAPGLGEHTQCILAELLEHTPAQTQALRDTRVVWWPKEGRVYARPSVV
jgi:crotonobetainyl-CoA:carnitine CoA-transferase CaiB-like acyl-CoA transferase